MRQPHQPNLLQLSLNPADFSPVPEELDGYATDHDFYRAEALHRIALLKASRKLLAAAGGNNSVALTLAALAKHLETLARQSIEGYEVDGGEDVAALVAELEAAA